MVGNSAIQCHRWGLALILFASPVNHRIQRWSRGVGIGVVQDGHHHPASAAGGVYKTSDPRYVSQAAGFQVRQGLCLAAFHGAVYAAHGK